MSHGVLQEVFTTDEVARAAGVAREAVQTLVDAGEVRLIPGTPFITTSDAVLIGRMLRNPDARVVALAPAAPAELFWIISRSSRFAGRRPALPAFASSFVHLVLLASVLWWTSGAPKSAPVEEPREPTRMVFLVTPGPGGGGGGGGLRNPLPARRVERKGPARQRVTVPAVKPERVLASRRAEEPPKPTPAPVPEPKPVEKAPEPLASRVLVAPVVAAAANDRDKDGAIESAKNTESQGAGTGGGAGTGQGIGNGEGLGSGIGEGSGGGTGGGPFRPGSGIEPPRLLREVKADYTDEARRRGITGDVVLEIVVRRDGSVGEVTVLQGLGAGLNQRAVAAVQQWRFSPARRRGQPVDVIVEVAVEFTLR
jgi:TonB family protein